MNGLMCFILIRWKWLISIYLGILLPGNLHGQLVQSQRYEIEVLDASEEFNVVANPNEGLLLFKRGKNDNYRFNNYQFIKLDADLNEVWRREIKIDLSLKPGLIKSFKDRVCFLYTIAGTFNLKVLDINLKSGTAAVYHIKNYIPISINTFEISDHAILIGGHYNSRPVILFYDRSINKSHLLPNLYSLEGELNHVSVNKDNSVDVVITGVDRGRNRIMQVYSFDSKGSMLEKNILFPDGKKTLQFGRIITHEDRKLIAGTYGRRRSEYSRGLFIAELTGDREAVEFYNYADLTNFFEYMKEKKVRRVKDRIERRKKAGKKLRFNYRLRVHDILRSGEDYILLAEAFYPKYKHNSYYSSGFTYYGSALSNLVFDGYHYTHAVLVGFNSEGNITWDNCIEINDVEKYTLDQVVEVSVEGEKILLYYNNENELNIKIINKDKVVKDKSSGEIKLQDNEYIGRNIFTNGKSGVIKWHDSSFYAYGVQKIMNEKTDEIKINKKVFFINRVVYK